MVESNQSILEGGLRGIQELCDRKRSSSAKNKQVKEGVFPRDTDDSVIFNDGECVIAFENIRVSRSLSSIHMIPPICKMADV